MFRVQNELCFWMFLVVFVWEFTMFEAQGGVPATDKLDLLEV